jgi:hypothetical protein
VSRGIDIKQQLLKYVTTAKALAIVCGDVGYKASPPTTNKGVSETEGVRELNRAQYIATAV